MIIIIMGVSGAGKSTIGLALAIQLQAEFAEGDSYHPAENIEKMQRGEPLNDQDRFPWLDRMAAEINQWVSEQRHVVLACSALKQIYRERLGIGRHPDIKIVYLRGDTTTIAKRIQTRNGHFMPPALLSSQFQTLEEPKDAIIVDVSKNPEVIIGQIIDQLSN